MKRAFLTSIFLAAYFITYAQQISAPYVIMVSFDGFRYDYVKSFNPPNFKKFIATGSQAEALIPSFPSKTFPNHYALVTGLNPGNHGLVDNRFYDPTRNTIYTMSDKEKVADPYYYGGVPLWELAKRNGLKSASYFWVGSELTDEARRPDYYFPFDDKVDPQKRVDQVIDWLSLPEQDRPHLITLYFSFPDHEGHNFGPNSEQTKQAVLRADSLLGNLMQRVESTKLPVNVILVSDHGMKELTIEEKTYIFIDELIDRTNPKVKIANGGTQTHVYASDKNTQDSVYAVLKKQEKNYTVLRKSEYPERWHYNNARVGDLMVLADPGYYIREGTRDTFRKRAKIGSKEGVHGYDPAVVEDMRGIFYAQGPNIKSGLTIEPFQNIHVFPFVAKILGLPLPKIDGKEDVLEKLYKRK